jgi:hypothetical protein
MLTPRWKSGGPAAAPVIVIFGIGAESVTIPVVVGIAVIVV